MICLQESFGLSTTDPARLDRLVGTIGLDSAECFNDAPETDGILVEVVDCSGEWQYRVVSVFEVTGEGRYPGEASFDQAVYARCDKRWTDFLIPLAETWAIGDRAVVCLQQSFGLSATDPAMLDRLIRLEALDVGACFNQPPETEYVLVEQVDCSGSWELQITDRFDVPADGEYPGEDYFERQAEQRCAVPWDYYYSPYPESWAFGDRAITCVTEPGHAAGAS